MPRGIHDGPRGGHNTVDMTGQTFDRLTVLSRYGTSKDRKATWLCRCACGGSRIVAGRELRSGHTRSCGCRASEATTQRNAKHGGAGTRLYNIWKDMHKRCRLHPHYAGRGIGVCADWATFPPFREWALRNGYKDHLTIDRYPDIHAGYAPGNCRWATRLQQSQNRVDRR